MPSSLIHNPVLTKSIEYTDESEKGSLALKMNEARLFHGSKLGNTLMPLENGWFKWTNANDGKYDKAHFFAESSVHADQKSSLLKSKCIYYILYIYYIIIVDNTYYSTAIKIPYKYTVGI